MSEIRLQKFMAQCGLGSRRKCEEYILQGLVRVNGRPVTELGSKVLPGRDAVKFKGRLLAPPSGTRTYILLHKPVGVVCTLSDEKGRPVIIDLLKGGKGLRSRVFPVGRLDVNTSGLLLLTDDGELTARLLHPSGEVPRTYRLKVKGVPDEKDIARLNRGVVYREGRSLPAEARLVSRLKANSVFELTLFEGRKREVRQIMERLGHTVLELKRVRFGPLSLGELPPGKWRFLSKDEVKRLRACVLQYNTRGK